MKRSLRIILVIVLAGCAVFEVFYVTTHRTWLNPAQPKQMAQNESAQSNRSPSLLESFDEPLRRIDVDLGPAPYSSGNHPEHSQLKCRYYNGFVVKELDMKQQGDEWIATAPGNVAGTPCTKEHNSGEIVVKHWSGYYAGAKGNLVFLNGDDGYNGGYPFGIFDSTSLKKIYEDSRELDDDKFSFSGEGKSLVVRYRHVEVAECSIPEKKNKCWEKIERKTGLSSQTLPTCAGYQGLPDETDPSVVSYPVELTLFPAVRLKLLPGPVKCWAAD